MEKITFVQSICEVEMERRVTIDDEVLNSLNQYLESFIQEHNIDIVFEPITLHELKVCWIMQEDRFRKQYPKTRAKLFNKFSYLLDNQKKETCLYLLIIRWLYKKSDTLYSYDEYDTDCVDYCVRDKQWNRIMGD